MSNLRRILCPTDFSPCAQHALDYAVDLAKRLGAELRLLHVVPEFDHYVAGLDMVAVMPQFLDQSRDRALETLERAQKALTGLEVHAEVRRGAPHEGILAAARDDVDLIVLGTHGRTGLVHLLLGSVAERIVRLSPVPVLTIRAPK